MINLEFVGLYDLLLSDRVLHKLQSRHGVGPVFTELVTC